MTCLQLRSCTIIGVAIKFYLLVSVHSISLICYGPFITILENKKFTFFHLDPTNNPKFQSKGKSNVTPISNFIEIIESKIFLVMFLNLL